MIEMICDLPLAASVQLAVLKIKLFPAILVVWIPCSITLICSCLYLDVLPEVVAEGDGEDGAEQRQQNLHGQPRSHLQREDEEARYLGEAHHHALQDTTFDSQVSPVNSSVVPSFGFNLCLMGNSHHSQGSKPCDRTADHKCYCCQIWVPVSFSPISLLWSVIFAFFLYIFVPNILRDWPRNVRMVTHVLLWNYYFRKHVCLWQICGFLRKVLEVAFSRGPPHFVWILVLLCLVSTSQRMTTTKLEEQIKFSHNPVSNSVLIWKTETSSDKRRGSHHKQSDAAGPLVRSGSLDEAGVPQYLDQSHGFRHNQHQGKRSVPVQTKTRLFLWKTVSKQEHALCTITWKKLSCIADGWKGREIEFVTTVLLFSGQVLGSGDQTDFSSLGSCCNVNEVCFHRVFDCLRAAVLHCEKKMVFGH